MVPPSDERRHPGFAVTGVPSLVDITASGITAHVLVEQSLVGVYMIRDSRFSYVNQRFADVFGYTVAEVLALPSVSDVVVPEHRDLVLANIAKRIQGRAQRIQYSFDGRHRDGSTLHVEVHGTRADLGGGPAVVGVLIDRTEGVKAERHAMHLQKLEAAGRLAAGIAHDFKNVLTSIGATAELLRMHVPDEAAPAAGLDQILEAVERGTRLSQELMDLDLEKPPVVASISLPQQIQKLQPMLTRMLKRGLTLDLDLAPDVPMLSVDPEHIEQILLNLVINAVDAMPDHGRILVSVRTDARAAGAGPGVCLQVQDTGPGIPTELIERVFEPYFTTKADKGTGLGLANVRAIAQSYGGVARIEPSPETGTTVTVVFPAIPVQV